MWVPAGALKEAGIPFTPAVGAIFLWADLRAALEEATWEVCLEQQCRPYYIYTYSTSAAQRALRADCVLTLLQAETKLWEAFVDAGVLLTPGALIRTLATPSLQQCTQGRACSSPVCFW